MGLSVGSDLLQMDKACRVFNRQPNKLAADLFGSGHRFLGLIQPKSITPLMPHANTRGGFLTGGTAWILQGASLSVGHSCFLQLSDSWYA